MTYPLDIPNKLVDYWGDLYESDGNMPEWILRHVAADAAEWGADQELEACVNYIDNNISGNKAQEFRAIRRPKPPSLRRQALKALAAIATGTSKPSEQSQDLYILRQALAELPD